LSTGSPDYAQVTYDKVADGYDELWSRNVAGPNDRLTRQLVLSRGDRVADLACGTGLFSIDMARRVTPGDVVGVDCSEGMLAAARERADDAGLPLSLVHARAEDFVARAAGGSFDVVSLRFALAYLDWNDVLPRMARLLRPGGRVGILTSLSGSIPQFAELYHRFRKSPEPAWKLFRHTRLNLSDTWRIFRQLRETFGEPRFIAVPDTIEQVATRLEAGGVRRQHLWTETIRLWFSSGREAVEWVVQSGYVTHHSLQYLGPLARSFVEALFSAGIEEYREARGIPLDLLVGGVVAGR
jgi:ubiquinone/menaquinone biosynthesis C-methylase UbiE